MKRTKPTKTAALVEKPRGKTTAVHADGLLESLEQTARWDIEHTTERLAAFALKLSANAASAFEWSYNSFEDAAKQTAAQYLLELIARGRNAGDEYSARSSEAILRELARLFNAEVLRKARWPERSTSPTSNAMSLCMMAAHAELLHTLNRYVERLGED